MKVFTKRAMIATALATAFVGVSATAIDHTMVVAQANAQAPATTAPTAKATPEQRAHRHAERMERMQKRMADRQAALKSELKITPEQEPAWNAFITRTQPQIQAPRTGAREDWSKLTTPERLDKVQAMTAERDARMQKRHEAIKSFYASLNPEQKKLFDEKQARGFQRTGMKHKGPHGEHHRMHKQPAPAAKPQS